MKLFELSKIALLSMFVVQARSTVPNRAPVIDRTPEPIKAKPSQAVKPTAVKNNVNGKDWRPTTYTVKKGDTLYSIGLDFGYDYKEIAQNNNIAPPYTIHIGEQLKIKGNSASNTKPAETANNDEVVIKPLNNENTIIQGQSNTVAPSELPLLNSPKALRENYSDQALSAQNTNVPTPIKAVENKAPEIKAVETKNADSNLVSEDAIDWGSPTKGKIKNGFAEGTSAKGIDIEGTMGQEINAVSNGKVIYNGSDLRGYGNLVIVKHNKDYLSVYAHNSKILVKEGQTVSKGQKIAEMGNSGTDAVKLHFEIRYQGKSVDPTKFITNL
jgi:lipoprotein NlpD